MKNSCTTHYAFKPRIIVLKHPSQRFGNFSFVPIEGNHILLRAQSGETAEGSYAPYLHLSIHEIRSDNRVGPALWSFNGSVDCYLKFSKLEVKKSTENAWEITLEAQFDDHWKLFNISISSTTETDALNNFPLIESGRIGYEPKPTDEEWPWSESRLGLSEIFI